MSSDRLALLDAIREEPHSGVPRRIYADWLDDHAEPGRAEYLRLSLLRPRTPPVAGRLAALWRRHGKEWRAGLPRGLGKHLVPRGLLLQVDLPAERFLAHGERLLQREPIFSLQLTHAGPHLPALAECPALAPLRRLEFRDTAISETDLAALLASNHLVTLRDLRFVNCKFASGHAGILAQAPLLARLTRLHVTLYQRTWQQPPEIVPYLTVKQLGLANVIRDEGARALAESPYVGNLDTLALCGNYFTERAGDILGRSSHFKSLRHLDLSYNDLHGGGLAAIARSPLMRQLQKFWLQSNEVGPEGAASLVDAENLSGLELLDLSGSLHRFPPLLNTAAARSLVRVRHLEKLRHLLLGWNEFRDGGAKALARAKNFPSLRTLTLQHNHIGPDGAKALAQSSLLGQLHRLDVMGNNLGDEGARAFLDAKDPGDELHLALSDRPSAFGAPVKRALRRRFGQRAEFEFVPEDDLAQEVP